MISLPHQEAIKFVKEIIQENEKFKIVSCSFPIIPTLAMTCEASAQATVAFAQDEDDKKVGFLISLKNVELLNELTKKEYLIKVEPSFIFEKMTEYKFELYAEEKIYVKGTLTIALQD